MGKVYLILVLFVLSMNAVVISSSLTLVGRKMKTLFSVILEPTVWNTIVIET